MIVVGEYTKLAQRKKRAMSRMILGFHGLLPPQELNTWLKDYSPAGFILFGRNVDGEHAEQVWECNQKLYALSKEPPILSVDQEGGRVRRIKNTYWPPMRMLGNLDDLELTEKIIRGINQEIIDLGFNANWAPCADVDSNPDNPVIGDRSFGRSSELCAKHVQKSIETMHSMNVIACAKHFPGHGDTDLDSHFELPTVNKDKRDIENCELIPFQRAIETGIQIIMTAHVIFPAFDPKNPATMSKRILTEELRENMGYRGLIVSDDMEMKAVRGRYPLEWQLDQSIRAGVDLFLMCSELELQEEAFEIMVRLQEKYPEHDQLAEDSAKRLHRIREKFFHTPPSKKPFLDRIGSEEYQQMAAWVRERGEGIA